MTKHGAPDWSVYRIDSVTYTVMDLAELAARLGSIVTFDRRGDVVWLDHFGHGLTKWTPILDGDDAAAAITPAHFLSHGYSAKLTCGSSATRLASLRSYKPYPRTQPLGLEASFTVEANHQDFSIYARTTTDGQTHLYQLLWSEADDTLFYFSTAGFPIALTPTVELQHDDACFHTLKLVFDPINHLYVRAILNHQQWDLSAIPPYILPLAGGPYLAIIIQYQGDAETNAVGYVDNVILTQDEP